MQIKNIVIFNSTNALNGSWIDVSNLVSLSVQVNNVEGNVWVEASNDPYVQFDGTNALSAPTAPVLTQGQAAWGNPAGNTYYVKTTYITKNGETLPSPESSLAVTAGNVLQVAPPAADSAGIAIGYNVYAGLTSGAEVLQTAPAYTPGWKNDSTPGIHFTTSGAYPLNQNFYLTNGGITSTGIAVPSSSTAGGPGVGLNITGNLATNLNGGSSQIAVFQNAGYTMALINPSGLAWKWLRVCKSNTAQTIQTTAYLLGLNG